MLSWEARQQQQKRRRHRAHVTSAIQIFEFTTYSHDAVMRGQAVVAEAAAAPRARHAVAVGVLVLVREEFACHVTR